MAAIPSSQAVRSAGNSGAGRQDQESSVNALTVLFAKIPRRKQAEALNNLLKEYTGSKIETIVGDPRHILSLFFQTLNSLPDDRKNQAIVEANGRFPRHGLDKMTPFPLLPSLEPFETQPVKGAPTVTAAEPTPAPVAYAPLATPPKANLTFREKTVSDLKATIQPAVDEKAPHLQKEEALTKKMKEEAYDKSKVVADYTPLFNGSIDCLTKLGQKEGEIKKLREEIVKAASGYIQRNNDWIAFLQQQCVNLGKQHALLANAAAHGGVTTAARVMGAAAVVKTATPTSTERYHEKIAEELASSVEYTETFFTPLFDAMAAYATNFKVLMQDLQEHLGTVKGARDFFNGNPFNGEELKNQARQLAKEYGYLHDDCLDAFARLNQDKNVMAALLTSLSDSLDTAATDISAAKTALVIATNKLAADCRAINPNKPGWIGTDPIKIFSATLTEKDKYPVDK